MMGHRGVRLHITYPMISETQFRAIFTAAIELIIKSGVDIVSSETISPSNDMLLPLEKKKEEKLITMDDSYRQGGL